MIPRFGFDVVRVGDVFEIERHVGERFTILPGGDGLRPYMASILDEDGEPSVRCKVPADFVHERGRLVAAADAWSTWPECSPPGSEAA
jgi:hypothetical protein